MVAAALDPAIWGLIGTVVGALIGYLGNRAGRSDEMKERAQRERRESGIRARDEHKQVYIRLLAAARQLRYRARRGSIIDDDEIRDLKSDLSNAHYEIELICPPGVVAQADVLVRKVLDYVSQARKDVSLTDNRVPDSPTLQAMRKETRAAVDEFIAEAHKDLEREAGTGGQAAQLSAERQADSPP
jgi:hypothetical protein